MVTVLTNMHVNSLERVIHIECESSFMLCCVFAAWNHTNQWIGECNWFLQHTHCSRPPVCWW